MCAAECAGADVKYVAHPACEELAGERALQEVRAGGLVLWAMRGSWQRREVNAPCALLRFICENTSAHLRHCFGWCLRFFAILSQPGPGETRWLNLPRVDREALGFKGHRPLASRGGGPT